MTTMTCTFHGLRGDVVARLVADAVDQVVSALDCDVDTLDGCAEPVAAWCAAIAELGGPIASAVVTCHDETPVGTVNGAVRPGSVSVDVELGAPLSATEWQTLEATPAWAAAEAFFSHIARPHHRPAHVVAEIAP